MIKYIPLILSWVLTLLGIGILIGKWGQTETETYGGVKLFAYTLHTILLLWLTIYYI